MDNYYELGKELSRGKFGVVNLGTCKTALRNVAIKTIKNKA